MRLLRLEDDGSFSLVEYLGSDAIPAYAILSHTWGSDQEEVNFKDLTESVQTLARAKAGYQKLTFCASQAARDGLRYCWADTCCINKADAAELQEAINSMFRWYRSATRCYVYLSDVSNDPSTNDDRSQRWKPALRQSRWFTRGWTLQELVAPTTVDFFSKEGTLLGNKGSLEQTIQEITGVAAQAIRGESLSQFSEKEILSWVENRQTKRDEDIVYCLLGFFDVFMPLIYGEGRQNALDRLREQVQKKSSNVVHKRAVQPKRAVHFSKLSLLQSTLCNTTTINYRLQTAVILFRLVAIRCICNFYCAGASVVASLFTTSAAPLSAHLLCRLSTLYLPTTILFSYQVSYLPYRERLSCPNILPLSTLYLCCYLYCLAKPCHFLSHQHCFMPHLCNTFVKLINSFKQWRN